MSRSHVDGHGEDVTARSARQTGGGQRHPADAARWPRSCSASGWPWCCSPRSPWSGCTALTHRYDRTVSREQLLAPTARQTRTDLDGRPELPARRLRPTGPARRPDQRSDTILIVHVPAGMRQAYLISVPRDLLVAIPPAAPGFGGGQDKINAAYEHGGGGEGGARLLSATLTRLTGIRFDGAALVDFSGFGRSSTCSAGIRMCVRHRGPVDPHRDPSSTGRLPADGRRAGAGLRPAALRPARAATTTGSGTSSSCSGRCSTGPPRRDLRSDPVQLDRVLRAVGGSLTVDTNGVPLDDLLFALRTLPADALPGVRLPSYPQTIDGRSPTWCWTTAAAGSSRPSATTRLPRLGRRQPAAG